MPGETPSRAVALRKQTLPSRENEPPALAARRENRKSWPARMPVLVGLITLTLLVGGFGGWAFFSSLAGAIVAPGRVQVEQNRQVVQHPDGGVVSEILIEEGDAVTAGAALIRLDATTLSSELAIVKSQLFEVLARRARLEAERDIADELEFDKELIELAVSNDEVADLIDGQSRLFEARLESVSREREQLEKQRQQINDQIVGITAQTEALQSQVALIAQELEAQQSLLERGLAQASRVLSLQREAARLEGQVGELAASKAQAEGRITEIEIESLKLTSRLREEAITRLRDIRVQELELRERRRTLSERLSRLTINAPASGVVYDLAINTPRSVIKPAEAILYIVPQDRPLVIAARVPPIHIDKVYAGQEVNLRFSALDQRRTPELFGTVVQVSADSFEDERTGAAYYMAEISLGEGELAKLPEGAALIPGMPAEAYILTAERSPIDYLVKPFWDYFEQAFRE
ncbi:HlyD family type I secretion periplasmic adaptor subunit [Rhodobacteraceae bacterium 63075]|nr:HlyD family type I secretion periplasmic adaptor subunit [Rhodobacteraceae bacterium 63075]